MNSTSFVELVELPSSIEVESIFFTSFIRESLLCLLDFNFFELVGVSSLGMHQYEVIRCGSDEHTIYRNLDVFGILFVYFILFSKLEKRICSRIFTFKIGSKICLEDIVLVRCLSIVNISGIGIDSNKYSVRLNTSSEVSAGFKLNFLRF